MANLGDNIKAVMKARGLRSTDLARYCGVTRGAVANWFATNTISKTNLMKVAEKLRVDAKLLVEEDLTDVIDVEARVVGSSIEKRRLLQVLGDQPPVVPYIAPPEQAKRTYSLDALEIAWDYDHLPSDMARARARAMVDNLGAGNPFIEPVKPSTSEMRAFSAPPPKKPSAAPKPRPRVKSRR